jgi:GNAT superfamily N-acetyltransferase
MQPYATAAAPPLPAVPDSLSLPFTLRDGTPIVLRPVHPADRERLAEGFEHLSETSRRLRFIGAMNHLNEQQLDYLTDVDGVNHVAWGALDPEARGMPGLGVGRFVRLPDAPDVAEFSLTVLDAVQGHGLGALLLAVLYAAAPGVGVHTLRGVVARENERMTEWMRRLGAAAAEDGTEIVFELPVSEDLGTLPDTPSGRSFRTLVEAVREGMRAA